MNSQRDSLGRQLHYLRISVTSRCNERCIYCSPVGRANRQPIPQQLTLQEILAVARVAVSLGFSRFRVTGGEPLIRTGLTGFLDELIHLPGVEEVNLTTNGTRLPQLARELYKVGLRRINVSLDSLDPGVYRCISGGDLTQVLDGIDAAVEAGFQWVKLNTVLIRQNRGELIPLVEFATRRGFPIRFVELMPIGSPEFLRGSGSFSIAEAKEILQCWDDLIPDERSYGAGPARYYRGRCTGAIVGFIGAMSDEHFCDACNKLRLTSDGKLRPCLGNHMEIDLLQCLRPEIDTDGLRRLFLETIAAKPAQHDFRNGFVPLRTMIAIGG
jgi:cyclic pyranopterin phosphate synthase